MRLAKNLLPQELVERAVLETRDVFVESFGEDMLLLIKIHRMGTDLLEGLLACDLDRGARWAPRSGTDTFTALTPLAAAGTRDRFADLVWDGAAVKELLRRRHFAMVMRKRLSLRTLDGQRITVGRSSNNDIVLMHPTVSKQHAWLEYDEHGQLFVGDLGSTNFTRVRGVIVPEGALMLFALGDELSFGDVEVRMCKPDSLWDAFHG
jgi:hypothetical protein